MTSEKFYCDGCELWIGIDDVKLIDPGDYKPSEVEACPKCGHYADMKRVVGVECDCGAIVEQYDATAGGADSAYSQGAAGTFDYPVEVKCGEYRKGCGRKYCDGDLVE